MQRIRNNNARNQFVCYLLFPSIMDKSPDIIRINVIHSYCMRVYVRTKLNRLGEHIRLLQNKMPDRDEGTFM